MINYISKKVTKALGLIALTGLSGLMSAQTTNNSWSLAGPVYNAGRIRNIVVDKNDATGKTIYAGSSSSGVFKTIDGGINWSPLNDQGAVRNISYMAQSADGTIYVSTGEGFLRPGQLLKAQKGTGLYKLSGSTLVSVATESVTGTVINRVACSPIDANYIAIGTNKGILISSNAGANFAPAAGISTTVDATYGMDVKFDNTGILYCSIGNERGSVFSVNFSNIPSKVYKSSAADLSAFSNITPTSSILSDSNYGRIELAIAPSDNSVIYASCARKSNNSPASAALQGLFVSHDAGATWGLALQGSSQLDPLTNGGTIASGDYAHVITVNPTNSDQLFFGGYSFYVYTKNASSTPLYPVGTWTMVGSNFSFNSPFYLHENIHDIKIVNTTPAKFYFVTDAGIFRSLDLATSNATIMPSFQPFYKGLVTGQFNSVSIETYPLSTSSVSTVGNSTFTTVVPFSGFIGGTGGNGLNYFSGTSDNVSQETSYLAGEVYNAEFSKILPGAALLSTSNGGIYRSSNIKNSDPTLTNINTYSGPLARITPTPVGFTAVGVTTGTPFKLWENYGLMTSNIHDPLVFYNDTTRASASMIGLATLTTQTTFTFSSPRPNTAALIDSIVIRTGTVVLATTGAGATLTTAFTGSDKKDISIKLANNYPITGSVTIPAVTVTGSQASAAGVTLNLTGQSDNISVTFTSAPFANKTIPSYPVGQTGTNITVSDPAQYYRVFATVFYKYKAGDVIPVSDNNISTRSANYNAVLTQSLSWQYGSSGQTYTISAAGTPSAITNPTYILTPGNVSQSSPDFSVHPIVSTTYTITNTGTYSLTATPVSYTIAAVTDTNVPGNPTYSYALTPGNITQTTTVFTVTPATTTNYTITQIGSSPSATNNTYSTVTTSYSISPGNTTQSTPVFTVNVGASPVTYTLTGISSTTNSANTSVTRAFPESTVATVGGTVVPFAANNPIVKVPTSASARLALITANASITGGGSAVVVSKAPLNLNEPFNFVRLSQTGCLTTNPDGTAGTGIITIPGKPIMLQWSNAGTELYYATDDNKLYRVSFIDLILDYSPASYSGKLTTDIFAYNSGGLGGVSNSVINYTSPYRTTLVGTFTKPITSISIASNDQSMVVTLDDPTGAQLVQYCGTMANANAMTFTPKNISGLVAPGTTTPVKIYCSLMEQGDPKNVYLGTDNGIYRSTDVTAGAWVNANNNQLPNVQVFDMKQQTMPNWACYNSGEIYVATNGRGVWTNSNYTSQSVVSIQEIERDKRENNISIFPNPTNGNVSVSFNGIDGESATVNVMDLSGRIIKSENLGKLNAGESTYSVETASLTSGIYLVNVTSTSGIRRVTKLVVAK